MPTRWPIGLLDGHIARRLTFCCRSVARELRRRGPDIPGHSPTLRRSQHAFTNRHHYCRRHHRLDCAGNQAGDNSIGWIMTIVLGIAGSRRRLRRPRAGLVSRGAGSRGGLPRWSALSSCCSSGGWLCAAGLETREARFARVRFLVNLKRLFQLSLGQPFCFWLDIGARPAKTREARYHALKPDFRNNTCRGAKCAYNGKIAPPIARASAPISPSTSRGRNIPCQSKASSAVSVRLNTSRNNWRSSSPSITIPSRSTSAAAVAIAAAKAGQAASSQASHKGHNCADSAR